MVQIFLLKLRNPAYKTIVTCNLGKVQALLDTILHCIGKSQGPRCIKKRSWQQSRSPEFPFQSPSYICTWALDPRVDDYLSQGFIQFANKSVRSKMRRHRMDLFSAYGRIWEDKFYCNDDDYHVHCGWYQSWTRFQTLTFVQESASKILSWRSSKSPRLWSDLLSEALLILGRICSIYWWHLCLKHWGLTRDHSHIRLPWTLSYYICSDLKCYRGVFPIFIQSCSR